jgi:hypothetical protein
VGGCWLLHSLREAVIAVAAVVDAFDHLFPDRVFESVWRW